MVTRPEEILLEKVKPILSITSLTDQSKIKSTRVESISNNQSKIFHKFIINWIPQRDI